METPGDVLDSIVKTRQAVQGFLLDAFDIIDQLRVINETQQRMNSLLKAGTPEQAFSQLDVSSETTATTLVYIAGLQKLLYSLSDLESTQVTLIQNSRSAGIFGEEGREPA